MNQDRTAADKIILLRAALRSLMNAAINSIAEREHEYKRPHYVTLEVAADEAQSALDETEGEVRL